MANIRYVYSIHIVWAYVVCHSNNTRSIHKPIRMSSLEAIKVTRSIVTVHLLLHRRVQAQALNVPFSNMVRIYTHAPTMHVCIVDGMVNKIDK